MTTNDFDIQEDILHCRAYDFKEMLNGACRANPDLPRCFIKNSLISLKESRDMATPFIPHSGLVDDSAL
jgi:hypothetical protein